MIVSCCGVVDCCRSWKVQSRVELEPSQALTAPKCNTLQPGQVKICKGPDTGSFKTFSLNLRFHQGQGDPVLFGQSLTSCSSHHGVFGNERQIERYKRQLSSVSRWHSHKRHCSLLVLFEFFKESDASE